MKDHAELMSVTAYLDSAAASYAQAKTAIEGWTGATQSLMHVHAGLMIFVATALLSGKKMRSPLPLTCVAVFAVLNEVVDWWSGKPINTAEPFVDFANTVFWPIVLFALARRGR